MIRTGFRLFSAARPLIIVRSCHLPITTSRKKPHVGLSPEFQIASLENQYYRWHLEAMQPVTPVPVHEPPDYVKKLEAICKDQNASIESPEFDETAAQIAEAIPTMPREMVFHILNLLVESAKHQSKFRNRNRIWFAIDSVLIKDHKKAERSPEVLRQSLNHAMLMCMANPGRIPGFVFNLCGSFVARLKDIDLNPDEVLKLLFILNLSRNPLPAAAAMNLQEKVWNMMDLMNIDAIGLFCAAFFKTQTKITDPNILIKIVVKAMVKENRTPEYSIALSSILKALRSQIIPSTLDQVRAFIDSFTRDEIRQMNLMCINHLCHLAVEFKKRSTMLLRTTVESLSNSLADGRDRVRFKDVVEILRSCDHFAFSPDPSLVKQIIAAFPSSDEIYAYPRFFIAYLSILASLGYFPAALIEQCFSYKFLKHAKEVSDPFPYIDLLMLHTILTIDCHPKFAGGLLRPEEIDDAVRRIGRVDVAQVMDRRSLPDHFMDPVLKSLFWNCKELFGDRIAYAFILPYMKYPEIVLLGKGQDIEWLKRRSLTPGSYTGCTCISVCTHQHYSDYQLTVQRNFYSRKKQLQQKLGFKVVEYHFSDLSHMSKTRMIQKLSKSLQ